MGLNAAQLVAVGSHDTASAYAAAPVSNPAHALIISSGTWSLVGKLVPKPITTPEAMAREHQQRGRHRQRALPEELHGHVARAGAAQGLARRGRARDGVGRVLTGSRRRAAPFAALIDPDDPGFYNPPNMEAAIAEFCRRTGQALPADRGTMLRSVYESLALKYRMVGEAVSAASGKPNRVVHIVGGGSKNEMLNQFAANATGLKVVAGPEEATAVGNAMVQAMAMGVIASLSEARR